MAASTNSNDSTVHYFGKNAELYDARRSTKPRWQAEDGIVKRYLLSLPKGARLLDVPFGTGRYASVEAQAELKTAGLDISSDMLDQARAEHGEVLQSFDLRTGDARALPFTDGSFDYIVSNRFIKWLPEAADVAKVASEFRRVCTKEMLVHVKLQESGTGSAARKAWRAIKGFVSQTDSGRNTGRYTMVQYRSFFELEGWKIKEVIESDSLGRGVVYLKVGKL